MARNVLVTGASRGIGRAIALALARQGFDLALNYRAQQKVPQAIAAYRDLIKLNEKNAEAWYELGVLLAQDRQKSEAIAAFNKYIDLVGDTKPVQVQGVREQIKALGGTAH